MKSKKEQKIEENDQMATLSFGRGGYFSVQIGGRRYLQTWEKKEVGNTSTITVISIEKKEKKEKTTQTSGRCSRNEATQRQHRHLTPVIARLAPHFN